MNHLLGIRFFFLIDWLEEYWLKESVGAKMVNPKVGGRLGLCGLRKNIRKRVYESISKLRWVVLPGEHMKFRAPRRRCTLVQICDGIVTGIQRRGLAGDNSCI